jgi:hypothetical protein
VDQEQRDHERDHGQPHRDAQPAAVQGGALTLSDTPHPRADPPL